MAILALVIQSAHEQVTQQQPAAPDGITYKIIIGAMGGFIMLLLAWIKQLIAENKVTTAERISDLKDSFRNVRKD